MGAHDRPFPPGGLPPDETKLYMMAYRLAYKTSCLQEISRADGQASQTAIRKIGPFHIEVEYHRTFPMTVTRYAVMIWFEDHLVFNAWCAMACETEEVVGLVVTCEDGPWKYHLRLHSEAEKKL
jgi:hypothetical protein